MAVNEEIEIKLKIANRADFEKFIAVLPPERRRTVQLNVYLDTKDTVVKGSGASLRLRVTRSAAWLTLKRRIGTSTGHTWKSLEAEVPVDRDMAVAWCRGCGDFKLPNVPEMAEIASLIGERKLGFRTWSRTIRHACELGEDIIVEVDETMFPDGTVDYEIEVEHVDPAKAFGVVQQLASTARISLYNQIETKHARARAHTADGPLPIPGEGDSE